MPGTSRRTVLLTGGVIASGFLAGCSSESDDSDSATASSTTAPSTTPPSSSTPTTEEATTASPTTTEPPDLSPEDLLPREGDGWTRDRAESSFSWSPRGASDGIFGHYTSPDEHAFEVVVMEMEPDYDPEQKAVEMRCTVEWSVALTYDRFAIAASTGTVQRTYTPESPPDMTRTPIPDTTDAAVDLLARSPELSREYVDQHAVSEADC